MQFAKLPEAGVPNAGVTKVGLVANTKAPEPVSSETAAARLALEGVAKNVATPVPRPEIPVATGSPVAFVKVAEEGVPNAGVTKVGLVDKTTFPEPVEDVTPVPPRATDNVPVVPAIIGSPVAFVNVAADGVPRSGVVNEGEFRCVFCCVKFVPSLQTVKIGRAHV